MGVQKVPKMDQKRVFFTFLSTFVQEEKQWKVPKSDQKMVFLKKVGKVVQKCDFGSDPPNPKFLVVKSDFLSGSKNWSIFGPKCWNVFEPKSGKTNSPTADEIAHFWACSEIAKIDRFFDVFLSHFLDPQKIEVVKELLYPPIFGVSQNYGFED